MIRKIFIALTLLCTTITAFAYDFMDSDGLCYDINSDGTSVTITYQNSSSPRYTSISGDLTIPESVSSGGKTYTVTSIGSQAFNGCSGLRSVSMGNSITIIGHGAFYGCSGLASVYIPNSVYFIGDHAFRECTGLTSVTIPNSVTRIGGFAFFNCSGLMNIKSYPNPANVSRGSYLFTGVPKSTCELHVLPQYLSAYQTAEEWKDFGNNIIGDLSDIKGDLNGDGSWMAAMYRYCLRWFSLEGSPTNRRRSPTSTEMDALTALMSPHSSRWCSPAINRIIIIIQSGRRHRNR